MGKPARASALHQRPEAPAAAKGLPNATNEALVALHGLPVVDAGGQQLTAAQVLGGVPADYGQIVTQLKRNEPAESRRVIVDYILDEVGKAISRRDRMLAVHPPMKTVLDMF